MTGSMGPRPDDMKQRTLSLWGWFMVVVVLLSAAPTGGQPRTRLVGSAFDPASISVAVRPSQTRLTLPSQVFDKRKTPDADHGGMLVFAIVESFDAGPRASSADKRRTGGLPTAPAADRLLWRAHGPRAPPAA